MSTVEYGVMLPDGHVLSIGREGQARIDSDAQMIATAMNGTVVTRAAVWSCWTDEPSACPRCDLPVWPSGLGALHADGQTDCLLREGVAT